MIFLNSSNIPDNDTGNCLGLCISATPGRRSNPSPALWREDSHGGFKLPLKSHMSECRHPQSVTDRLSYWALAFLKGCISFQSYEGSGG